MHPSKKKKSVFSDIGCHRPIVSNAKYAHPNKFCINSPTLELKADNSEQIIFQNNNRRLLNSPVDISL
jgi:hypothetical protein